MRFGGVCPTVGDFGERRIGERRRGFYAAFHNAKMHCTIEQREQRLYIARKFYQLPNEEKPFYSTRDASALTPLAV